jgi:hypothetical protein
MPFIILASLILGGLVVYVYLNPAKKIEATEKNELEALDAANGKEIDKIVTQSNLSSIVIERYFYLKHKYHLTKKK